MVELAGAFARGCQGFTGCGVIGFAQAAQHLGQLIQPGGVVELAHLGGGAPVFDQLAHAEMLVAVSGQLRQVRDAQHFVAAAKLP